MLKALNNFIKACSELKVAVVGETIVDEFIPVTYEGQSMKSICPVYRHAGEKKVQAGGASAIANHLKNFVGSVDLFSNSGDEIVKTRYMDIDDHKKHVEINKFNPVGFPDIHIDTAHYDLVIVADFGHGYCNKLKINDGFHLMCQTNSNNFGFNRISKWKKHKKKSVCLDLREASLQINKRIKECSEADAREIYNYELNCHDLFITLGASGSLLVNDGSTLRHKTFKTEIVDTIGAGDTFFSFAALASHLEAENKLLIPSLAASLSTTWLCNEHFVTPDKLLKHAANYLQ